MIFRMRITGVAIAVGLMTGGSSVETVTQQASLASLSADIVTFLAQASGVRVPVIVAGVRADIQDAAGRLNVPVLRELDEFVVLLADADAVRLLQLEPGVQSISGDMPVVSAMSVSNRATAADQAWAGGASLLRQYDGVTGRGIGVAIVDSGIAPHRALEGKVIAAVSFVPGDPDVADGFGHGSHIAGIVAGRPNAAAGITNLYRGGIAPEAHLVSVKVLGRDGSGRTSDVIAGIDWVIANRARYGVRIVNLSLGHPVTEPSLTDPLNATVVRAVASGLLVVVSAGNSGMDADGRQVVGSITSPGNSPHALTVGALNTWGTVDPSDDTVTTYSSRGPTEYEFSVKPDVVAPGNKIVSLEVSGSTLEQAYPAGRLARHGSNAYRRMSGTSMAAGLVSGAAALLLEAAPDLTPRHVKIAIQGGASAMPREGLIAAGAGSVNVWASRRTATDGPSDLLPSSLIEGVPVLARGLAFFDNGTLVDGLYHHAGSTLLGPLDLLFLWSDPSRIPFGRLNLFGLAHIAASTPAGELVWGSEIINPSGQQVIWGDHLSGPAGQQVIWGDSNASEGYQVIWGDAYHEQ